MSVELGVRRGLSLSCLSLERPEVRITSSVGPSSWRCLTAGCAKGVVWGGSKPKRDPGRLHGLLDHRQQLAGQGLQVDLLAQPPAERLDHAGGVVAAPV